MGQWESGRAGERESGRAGERESGRAGERETHARRRHVESWPQLKIRIKVCLGSIATQSPKIKEKDDNNNYRLI